MSPPRRPLTGPGSRGRQLVLHPQLAGRDVGRAIASQKLLGATFLVAIAVTTIPRAGEQLGIPSPRRYAAIVLLWFIFGLAAELGGQVARFTGALAALVTLAMAMGTGGLRALEWLREQAFQLAPASPAELPPGVTAVPRGSRERPQVTIPATARR